MNAPAEPTGGDTAGDGTVTGDAQWRAQVETDPWFSAMWRAGATPQALEHAGFFADGLTATQRQALIDDIGELPADLERIAGRDGAVLVATGGFAPLHAGHITMVERAAEALQAAGIDVAGGFICCDHDDYVSTKAHTEHWGATTRTAAATRCLAGHPWIATHHWSALDAPCALNFTDICARIANELTAAAPQRRGELWYVFGSDNAGFAEVFNHAGHAVCVPRPGHPAPRAVTPRLIVAEEGIAANSTEIRAAAASRTVR